MTMKRWDGAAFIDLTVAKRWDGAAWVDLTVAKRWDGSAWIDIPLPGGGGGGTLTASASPGSASGYEADDAMFVNVTSNSVTVTPAGGTAPYSHLWVKVSGDSSPLISSTTAATVSWTGSVPRWQSKSATWKDTITDSLGATTSINISVNLVHDGTGIPP